MPAVIALMENPNFGMLSRPLDAPRAEYNGPPRARRRRSVSSSATVCSR